jgi:DNA-directed RNA polymerase subunit RPC12/RpoP
MFFNKKIRCSHCNSKIGSDNNYCNICGSKIKTKEKEIEDYGILGRIDEDMSSQINPFKEETTFTDKMINSFITSIMKSLEKQFSEMDKKLETDMQNAEVKQTPNGIMIRFNPQMKSSNINKPQIKVVKKQITDEQRDKISKLPRTKAKSDIKRLNKSLIYELITPGVSSMDDVFISKLEEGYEIKAIGTKKMYVNSFPIDLPLKRLSLQKDKLIVEFNTN